MIQVFYALPFLNQDHMARLLVIEVGTAFSIPTTAHCSKVLDSYCQFWQIKLWPVFNLKSLCVGSLSPFVARV